MSFINPANLSAPQRIERVTALIMADKHLMQYGPLILFARVQVGKARTAYTDGRIAVIGAEFIKELDDAELAFVVLHEILHIAYRHLYIYRHLVKKDAALSNRAMDYVINLQLAALAKLTKVLRVPMKDGKPNCLLDAK
jgi:predicted metal-dependent peptidase